MSVSPEDYVVLDVETNGTSSRRDDLLSISLYKPDDEKRYDRFLPLDLNDTVPPYITMINGITDEDLRGLEPLSQTEVDRLFKEFELDRRTILHYGTLDEPFIRNYFRRNKLRGYGRMRFYNFKQLISATAFSDGSLTKDNLCRMFGIEGVTSVHSGGNDCILEWKLFQRIAGRRIIAYLSERGWVVEALSPDYLAPASYLSSYTHLSDLYPRPNIHGESTLLRIFPIRSKRIRRFPSNFSGVTVENLINTMLHAEEQDNSEFLRLNRAKNEHLGVTDHQTEFVPLGFQPDGTVKAVRKQDQQLAKELNNTLLEMKRQLKPLINFIRDDIFKGKPIKSQELVVDEERQILALCDLSTQDAVLEIKTSNKPIEHYAEQLYYESNGRTIYLLTMSWPTDARGRASGVNLYLWAVHVSPEEAKPVDKPLQGKPLVLKTLEEHDCELLEYFTAKDPIQIRCKSCGFEWNIQYDRIKEGNVICRQCHPKIRKTAKKPMTPEEALRKRAQRLTDKVLERSGETLMVDTDTYTGSRNPVTVKCTACGHVWQSRSDHLLSHCRCPHCHAGRHDTQ